VNVGDGASLELVDVFCYLGVMLSVDGDADAAVEARVCKGWNKFRQLVCIAEQTEYDYTFAKNKMHRILKLQLELEQSNKDCALCNVLTKSQ